MRLQKIIKNNPIIIPFGIIIILALALFGYKLLNPRNIGASVLQVYQGGTGAQNFTAGQCLIGAGTGAVTTGACGGGGGSSLWATSTDELLIYPSDLTDVVVVGDDATSTSGYIFEVDGRALIPYASSTAITATNFYGALTGTASGNLSLTNWFATTTDVLDEGSVNKYYADALVDSHLSGGTGITYTTGAISFDCSEVEGTGIDCSGESVTLNATGDWTGTIDSVDFGNGTLAQNAIWVGGAAAIPSELALGTGGTLLGVSGGTLAYISTSTIPVAGGITGTLGATVVTSDGTWTTHNSYPTACTAGQYVSAIGDTLTCAADQTGTGGAGTVSTSTIPTISNLAYWTSSGAWPETLSKVATTSLTATAPMVLSNAINVIGPTASVLTCTAASGSVAGCLSAGNWNTFNLKVGTSSAPVLGNLSYWTGTTNPTLGTVGTSTLTGTYPISISNSPVIIGSAGAVVTFPATSTLYGTGTAGQVLMWSGTAPVWAATSTGSTYTTFNNDFDVRLTATTTLPRITTLLGLTNASTTLLTATGGWITTLTNTYASSTVLTATTLYGTNSVLTYSSSTAFSSAYASSTVYYGAGLTSCTTGKITWDGGLFGCGTDNTGSGGAGTISTSTTPVIGNLSYWTGIGWPTTLGTVATTSLTATAPLALSNVISVIGPTASALTCTTAASGVAGCLSNTAFDTFNNKQATISATWPITLTGAAVEFNGLSTSSAAVISNIPYFSGVNTFANVGTSTLTGTYPISISNSPVIIGASGAVVTFPATSTLYGTGAYGNFLMWNGTPTWTATSTLTSLTNLVQVGTLTTGVWNATAITTPYGGTGLGTGGLKAGFVPYGAGTSAFATSSLFHFDNSTLTVSYASSTSITISGTGYITGSLGIGTTSPYAMLSVAGQVVGQYFTATSTIASTFPNASTTLLTATRGWITYASSTSITVSGTSYLATLMGTIDASGASSFAIPSAANPTIDATGEIAINSTAASSSIRFYDGTAERALYPEYDKSFSFASSTLTYAGAYGATGTTTLLLMNSYRPVTLTQFYCKTDIGTAYVLFGDGVASTTCIQCTTTGTSNTPASNNTWTIRENFKIQIGTQATSPSWITVTATLRDDAD